jgi:glucose/arabinose dehydrogenase
MRIPSTALATIALLLSTWPLRAAILPTGFAETQYGANVGSFPTAMEFSPDGRLFVCLQGGALRVISNGNLLPTPFVTVPTSANNERGLLGIAFDPDFANNQYVYVYYTVITSPIHNRVSRFTANGDVAVTGSETPILDLDNLSSATNHNGGAIHFGPDGKLYVAVGENGNSANAQSIDTRLGKILRINSDGTIPPDNPTAFPGIPGSPSGANQAIWAVGLRNPFTFGFEPGTGRLLINDVGESTWEEINDGIAGSNYGWGLCEGFCSPPDPNHRDPLFEYGHGTGCAIVGGAFYAPAVNQFPPSYRGKYFFSDFCSGWIRLFDPSDNTASSFATGISSPADLKVGPEGSLYYLARGNGGQVWKISFVATPTPTPTPSPIVISGTVSYCSNPNLGPVPGVTVTLTGSASATTMTDTFGNYLFSSLASGGTYTVTPTKPNRVPGSAGIDTVDLVAVQRQFLRLGTPLSGCRLTAADVNSDSMVNTVDVVAIQRFFLGSSTGIGNTGKYQFSPVNRIYPGLVSDQTGQNYDALIFGDAAPSFVH